MWREHPLFKHQKPDRDRLLSYGFVEKDGIFSFSTDIMDEEFSLVLFVQDDYTVNIQVIDKSSAEEYAMAYIDGIAGAYVGAVREECETVIRDIISKCFYEERFKSPKIRDIIAYIRQNYSIDPEYLWDKSPCNAIFREKSKGKWFAVIQSLDAKKLGLPIEGNIEILNLKEKPEHIQELLGKTEYLPAFHMNKKHWYTIPLDGSVDTEKICSHINVSYELVRTVKSNKNNK